MHQCVFPKLGNALVTCVWCLQEERLCKGHRSSGNTHTHKKIERERKKKKQVQTVRSISNTPPAHSCPSHPIGSYVARCKPSSWTTSARSGQPARSERLRLESPGESDRAVKSCNRTLRFLRSGETCFTLCRNPPRVSMTLKKWVHDPLCWVMIQIF